MKKISALGVMLMVIFGASMITQSTFATDADSSSEVFASETSEDVATLKMGQNLFLAGDKVIDSMTIRGLLFAAGNSVQPNTQSEYAFIAGNQVELKNTKVEKDLFVAGNSVRLEKTAIIGRDVYAAAQNIVVATDLEGNLAVTADTLDLYDVTIDGDLNLSVEELRLSGDNVKITGKIIINSDAEIIELANHVEYQEIEKYELARGDYWTEMITAKAMSIVGIFVAMVIVLAMFPRVNKRVAREISGSRFAVNVLVGLCTLVLMPVACVILLMTIFAAPAGILLLLAYIIMIVLSQGFAGFWIGKLLVEGALGRELNKLLEALIGIIILSCATMIPVVGAWISFLVILLGLGLIVQSMRRKQIGGDIDFGPQSDDDVIEEAEVVTAKAKTKTAKKTSPKATSAKASKRKTPDTMQKNARK